MNCKHCSARGRIWLDDESYVQCPECHGFGVIQGCEGAPDKVMVFEPPIVRGKSKSEVYEATKDENMLRL